MLNSVQRIIPTILATSQKEFEDRLKSVENLVDLVHLDIADGIADGIVKDSAARVFDAGRLDKERVAANKALVEKMLERIEAAVA